MGFPLTHFEKYVSLKGGSLPGKTYVCTVIFYSLEIRLGSLFVGFLFVLSCHSLQLILMDLGGNLAKLLNSFILQGCTNTIEYIL